MGFPGPSPMTAWRGGGQRGAVALGCRTFGALLKFERVDAQRDYARPESTPPVGVTCQGDGFVASGGESGEERNAGIIRVVQVDPYFLEFDVRIVEKPGFGILFRAIVIPQHDCAHEEPVEFLAIRVLQVHLSDDDVAEMVEIDLVVYAIDDGSAGAHSRLPRFNLSEREDYAIGPFGGVDSETRDHHPKTKRRTSPEVIHDNCAPAGLEPATPAVPVRRSQDCCSISLELRANGIRRQSALPAIIGSRSYPEE